jgi:hypothetical protein
VAEDGSSSVPLCSFPSYTFPSFVLVDPTETFAVVGESDFGLIHQVDLTLGGAVFVADIDYNYDALFTSNTELLITAAPCLANCGSTLERLDLTTGQVSTVATLPGPSGPIALAPNGDLYYGLQPISFPAPPGSWTIVYWRASQLASGNLLSLSDAFYFTGGLDGSSSMLFDPVYGHLLVAESPSAARATSWPSTASASVPRTWSRRRASSPTWSSSRSAATARSRPTSRPACCCATARPTTWPSPRRRSASSPRARSRR